MKFWMKHKIPQTTNMIHSFIIKRKQWDLRLQSDWKLTVSNITNFCWNFISKKEENTSVNREIMCEFLCLAFSCREKTRPVFPYPGERIFLLPLSISQFSVAQQRYRDAESSGSVLHMFNGGSVEQCVYNRCVRLFDMGWLDCSGCV